LSLSTNAIEKIANLNGLKHLKILCLSRNNIKNLNGLEAIGESLGKEYKHEITQFTVDDFR